MSAAVPASRGTQRPATILNVDDNEPARYAKTRILLNAGYEVIEAATGAQALQLVRESRPDLVLLDVKLPDMDGYRVCQRIRSDPESAATAVIQTSASFVDLDAHVRALEGGADSYLIAPFEPAVLVASVRALLRMRRAENELVETREAFRATFEQAPVGIAHVAEDGTWLRANRALLDMLGLDLPPSSLFVESLSSARAKVEQQLERLFAGTLDSFSCEEHLEDANGGWHDVSLTVSLVNAPVGTRYAIVLLEDIGEQKRSESERRFAEQQRDQLLASERAARLEAEHASQVKDLFLATLSHELRTPLNAILGWAQILRSGPRDPAAIEEAVDIIERNARAQSVLISDLLDVIRIVAGKVRLDTGSVSLAEVVSAAVATWRPDAEAKGIRLDERIGELGNPVFGDAARLQQIVWNLVSNAIKFTSRGGAVEVVLERHGPHARISVRDTGQGIEPKFLPHLFERFRQGDPSLSRRHGGLGLGLSIVRSLVELHGGRVRAHSAGEGQGSTFVVELPLGDLPCTTGAQVSSAEESAPPDALVGKRVLLVDDDYDAREFVRRMLVQHGAEVCSVASGREALATAAAFDPDVLVSDIGMPEMDGYELLRNLRERTGEAVPAVALTAYARDDDRNRAHLARYAGHIPKPVQEREHYVTLANHVANGH
jgi:PAS domain S-box-containing protein